MEIVVRRHHALGPRLLVLHKRAQLLELPAARVAVVVVTVCVPAFLVRVVTNSLDSRTSEAAVRVILRSIGEPHSQLVPYPCWLSEESRLVSLHIKPMGAFTYELVRLL